MPVTDRAPSDDTLLQRDQYAKGGITRIYWDYRDRTIMRFLDRDDRVIFDIGCGEGITLEKLIKHLPGHDIFGIDSLPENVRICLQHNLPVRFGDTYALNILDESVDAVLFIEVVEHLEEPEAAIAEIHRILRPQGKLLLGFPNDRSFMFARLLTLKFKEALFDPGHVHQWTPRSMRKALERHGFSVKRVLSIPFVLWAFSLHCVIVAEKTTAAPDRSR